MTPRVLLLSGLYDFSTDIIAADLADRNVPFLRLNREHLAHCRLNLDPVAGVIDVRSPSGEAAVIDADNLRSVFFRQPVFLRNTPGHPLTPDEQLQRSQWAAFLRGLTVFDTARWMNHPAKTYLAESKPYQLRIAAKLGFKVPRTRIGNDVKGLQTTMLGNPLIAKSLDTILLREGDDCLFTYSTIANSSNWTDDDLASAPGMFQELIHDKTDIRVTVVGETIFAARIQENGCGISGDWRVRPRNNVEFIPMSLSTDCAARCLQLVKTLGLSFAAIDLLERNDDQSIFFLEVNPTGEWGWLVRHGLTIDTSITSWLAG
jgi:glutathione synthase/RimK-type ligase-like ATP-grasp enzyme